MLPASQIMLCGQSLSADAPSANLGQVFGAREFPVLRVEHKAIYNNFAQFGALQAELSRFFAEIGNPEDRSARCARDIMHLVDHLLAGLAAETGWITVRASKPTTAHDTPRWHCDGFYFPPEAGRQLKLVVSLKGSGTLFNPATPEKRERYLALSEIPHTDPDRESKIAGGLGMAGVEQAETGDVHMFLVGPRCGAIHSEPPIHEQRIFMSLVPGSPAQIESLRLKWQRPHSTYQA